MTNGEAWLLPWALLAVAVLTVLTVVVHRVDRARRGAGRRPLGGSGPWVFPVVLAIIVVGWLGLTWLNR